MGSHLLFSCRLVTLFGLCTALPALSQDADNPFPPDFEGLLVPSETIELASDVVGVIHEIRFDRGDRVRRGDVVARLRTTVEDATIKLAEARLEFGRRKLARNEKLYRKELLSDHERDEIETEVEVARYTLAQARARREQKIIQSPITGVVVERQAGPGERTDEQPIVTIAAIHPLYIEVTVPLEKLGTIEPGMIADVTLEAPLDGQHKAKVTIVDPIVDAASGTFGVRLELSNEDHTIPAGLKCRVLFPTP